MSGSANGLATDRRMFSPSSGGPVRLLAVPSRAPLHGAVYDGDASSRRAAAVIVERSGVEVVDVADGDSDIVDHVRLLRPDVIVLELALAGTCGLGIVPVLLAAVPGSAIVLLSPFGGLRDAALRAGAYDLVDGDDLRELRRSVRRLVADRGAREAEEEPTVAVEEVAAVRAGEGPGDRQPEARPTPAVEADEALEDPLGHLLGHS